MQTFWTATKQHGPPIYYRRKVFDADHETYRGIFAVDFVTKPFEETDAELPSRTVYYKDDEFASIASNDKKPMLIILHGLSGGSHEIYLRHAIAPLVDSDKWEICVVNSRGCAQSKITTGVLYNARATWDVRQFVKWARRTFPNRPLFGLGFSLGANILTNYCGEEGENCQLKAAIVCSNPFNLDVSSKMLQSTLLGREVYLRVMGSSMRELADIHKEPLTKYTTIDMEHLKTCTYLNEFDAAVQCPTWGYPTAGAYYRDSSSSESVLAIRIPFLAIQAVDDPIAVKEALPYDEFKQNPNTVMLTTSLGGHLCWFESGGGRWHAKPVCNFFNYMAFETDVESIKPMKEAGRDDLPLSGSNFDPMRRKMLVVQM
ncbi:alpha/beta hydrolase fold domain-containing protein [Sarocladium implicatum]|nr:alpha/beta hydrolase fold domain-containing protein [Sarocladium implicatum]